MAAEPAITLVRHGATEWSQNGRHTSTTDLPLLPEGQDRAKRLEQPLAKASFATVLCSPLLRARQTCELAGFSERMQICDDLTEWSYGDYEGLTSPQIRQSNPSWDLWTDGCPGGESPEAVVARTQRVIDLAMSQPGDVICFAHGHILRVLASVWISYGARAGERLLLAPSTISRLGHEHSTRVIEVWNADHP